jgi:microcystin-dependent protein
MSQFDFGTIDPYVDDGVLLADDLNQWRDALYSQQRGPARPTFAQPGQLWVNDSAGTNLWQVNVYSGPTKGDVPLFNLDTALGVATLAAAMQAVTQTSGDSSQKLATTAFVQNAVNAAVAIALAQIFPVGTTLDLPGQLTVAPAGWVLAINGTIGNPASGATIRAMEDCRPLYTHLWTTLANTEAPVTGGRGSSANADFDAAKPIGGLDFRGLTRATLDRLGGTAANRLTTFARAGQIGGEEYHQLSWNEMPQHNHGLNWSDPGHQHYIGLPEGAYAGYGSGGYQPGYNLGNGSPAVWSNISGTGIGASIQYAGSSSGHYNTQPTRTVSTIIKL